MIFFPKPLRLGLKVFAFIIIVFFFCKKVNKQKAKPTPPQKYAEVQIKFLRIFVEEWSSPPPDM